MVRRAAVSPSPSLNSIGPLNFLVGGLQPEKVVAGSRSDGCPAVSRMAHKMITHHYAHIDGVRDIGVRSGSG